MSLLVHLHCYLLFVFSENEDIKEFVDRKFLVTSTNFFSFPFLKF